MLTTFKPQNVGLYKKEKVHELIWELYIWEILVEFYLQMKMHM